MRRVLFAVVSILLCTISAAQENLKGTIFLERTSIFYPKMQFGELVKGDAEEMELNLYDGKKKLIYNSSIKGSATLVERNYYFYDEKGNLSKLFAVKSARNEEESYYDNPEICSYTHEYKFNPNGKLSSDDITLTKYDTNGEILSSSFFGKIRYSYANGKTTTKYYDANGMEINDDKDDAFGKSCMGVKNKKEEILWFSASTFNVKKDSHGNVTSYNKKVKGAITDYVEKATISYKYDKFGNCIAWNKKTSEDLKLLGVGGNAGDHYSAMTKDLKYSASDSEYKDELATAQQWLLDKPYCPAELIMPYCQKDVERLNALYSKKQYRDIISEWCDTCVYNRLESMNNLYVNSVTNLAEQYADNLKFSEAIDVLQKLKANENFEGYYDSNRLDNLIASYEKANLKLEYDKYVKSIKSLISESKYTEAANLLKEKERFSSIYDSNVLRNLESQVSKGTYEQTLAEAERLYNEGKYAECYEFVEAMKQTKERDANRENSLKQKCKDGITDIYKKKYEEAKWLHLAKKNQEAMDKLEILKSHVKYIPESIITDYTTLKKECWMDYLCDDATSRLEQAENYRKAKEWQKVYDSLKAVDEKYNHCKSYEDIVKLRQKAEKKLGITK